MTTIIRPHRPIAHRVARRHVRGGLIAEVPDDKDFSAICSAGGLSAFDVRRLILNRYGIRVLSIVFRAREAAPGEHYGLTR
jgi:hypothetical protein